MFRKTKMLKRAVPLILAVCMVIGIVSISVNANPYYDGPVQLNGDVSELDVLANYESNVKYPLSLDVSSPEFYFNANLSPGDTATSKIHLQNKSDKTMKITVSDVENQLADNKLSTKLLEILNLTVSVNGEIYYQGIHSDLMTPVIPWIEIKPNQEIILDVKFDFPREADNSYQGAKYRMKWVFQVSVDSKTPAIVPKETIKIPDADPVKTGITSFDNKNTLTYIVFVFLIISALSCFITVVVKLKNKQKN